MRLRNRVSLPSLEQRLETFADEYQITGKGPLSLMLVLTRQASRRGMPLIPTDFLTKQGGQVARTGRSAIRSILRDHGIQRVLAEEAGRTSRGSIARMQAYLDFLNKLNDEGCVDFPKIEEWWIVRVKEYFASEPFKLKLDPSKSLRHAVHELLDAAFKRQKELPGTMVAGALMQHLVGAKLEIMSLRVKIEHRGSSVADAPGGYKGDFLIHDVAIHVTTAPTEGLIRKCQENLEQGLRPVIVTTERGIGGATALAQNVGLAERIDILEVEQFVTTNVYEKSGFANSKRTVTVNELVERYNKIIDCCESDPSLRILVGS